MDSFGEFGCSRVAHDLLPVSNANSCGTSPTLRFFDPCALNHAHGATGCARCVPVASSSGERHRPRLSSPVFTWIDGWFFYVSSEERLVIWWLCRCRPGPRADCVTARLSVAAAL